MLATQVGDSDGLSEMSVTRNGIQMVRRCYIGGINQTAWDCSVMYIESVPYILRVCRYYSVVILAHPINIDQIRWLHEWYSIGSSVSVAVCGWLYLGIFGR